MASSLSPPKLEASASPRTDEFAIEACRSQGAAEALSPGGVPPPEGVKGRGPPFVSPREVL